MDNPPDADYEPATLAEIKEGSETNHTTMRAAVSWHLSGADWATIAARFGFGSPQAARMSVEKFEGDMVDSTDVEAARNKALSRYERLLHSVWVDAITPYKLSSTGKRLDERNDAHTSALDRARGLVGDIVRLKGLAAPAQLALYMPGQEELMGVVSEIRAAQQIGAAQEADIWDVEFTEDESDDEIS